MCENHPVYSVGLPLVLMRDKAIYAQFTLRTPKQITNLLLPV